MSGLSGYAQGINEGLRSLATIQGIRTSVAQNERGERADARGKVIQGREDTAYAEAEAKSPFKTGMPGGEEVQNYLVGYGSNLGLIDAGGNIKKKDRPAFQQTLNTDTHAQHDILQIQRRGLTREIGELQKSLQSRDPSADTTGVTENITRQIREKTAQKINLDNTDKAFLAEQAQKNKEKEFGMKEDELRTETARKERETKVREKTADKQTTPSSVAGLRARAIETGDDRYAKAADLLEKADTERARIKKETEKEGTAFQKDIGFLVTEYGMSKAEALEFKKSLAGKSKKDFVLGVYQNAIKEGITPKEAQAAMDQAGKVYDRLSGTTPAPAAGVKTIRPAPGAGGKATAKRLTFNPKTGLIE